MNIKKLLIVRLRIECCELMILNMEKCCAIRN